MQDFRARDSRDSTAGRHAKAFSKNPDGFIEGYPIPLNTKKRDCLVAYSHSARDHFENAFGGMIKSKYFMTVLRAIVTNMTATWRFDSIRFFNPLLSNCENNARARARAKPLLAARMPNQIDCRANKASVSLRSFAAPTALQISAV
jgi:hypothetical protein